MTQTSSQVLLAIGSNLHKPSEQVIRAFNALAEHPDLTELSRSSLYSSTPRGPQDQDNYVNAAMLVSYASSPLKLLHCVQQIEKQFGRLKERRWGERVIDIDIAFFGSEIVNLSDPDLVIPHREALLRDFVLIPCLEICPNWSLPNGEALLAHASACENHNLRKLDVKFGLY